MTGGVGRHALLGDDLAEFPGIGVGRVGSRLWRLHCLYSAVGPAREPAVESGGRQNVRPRDLFRLLEAINLQRTFGLLRLAVQGGRRQTDFHRLVGRRCQSSAASDASQRRVAGLHGPLGGAGLAVGVGHVGRDLVAEDRLVLFGHGRVGLGDELDRERAVGRGFGRAVGDFLAPDCCGIRQAKHQSTSRDSGPRGRRGSGPWPRRSSRRCRPSPCLAARPRRPAAAAVLGASSVTWNLGRLYSSTLIQALPGHLIDVDHHAAHEAVARGGETAAYRAVVVADARSAGRSPCR